MPPLHEINRIAYWAIVLGFVLLAIYCLMWSIQTAWLGSFPGADHDLYSRWTYMQLSGAVAAIVVAVIVGIKGRRRKQR